MSAPHVASPEMSPRAATSPAGLLTVLAETAYPETTAASRVRVAEFAPFLRPHGVDLRLHPLLSASEYALISSQASVAYKLLALAGAAARAAVRPRPSHDLYLIQRLRFLSPLPGVDPPDQLDIYDFDDALFLGAEGGLDQRLRWIKQEARRCIGYLRRTKLAIAGNSFLADVARRYASRVEVVPSCVDPTRHRLHTHADSDQMVIGWIGSRSTSPYLLPVLPAISRLNDMGLRSKLVLVGASRSINAPWIEHRAWSPDTETEALAGFDVGIMPLPDNHWSRGKCGYKALQYFAAGVPAVASPIGVARDLIGSDRGFLATGPADWTEALARLHRDVLERRQRGEAAREFVEREYSYQRWAPELARLLRSVEGTSIPATGARRRLRARTRPEPGRHRRAGQRPAPPARTDPPKVLQLLACDDIGGTENMVCAQVLGRHADRVAYEVAILASPGPISARLQRAGVVVHSLGGRSTVAQITQLTSLLRQGGFDILNPYGFKATMLGRAVVARAAVGPGHRPPVLICGVRGVHTTEVSDVRSRKARGVALTERLTRDAIDIWDANSLGGAAFVRSLGVAPERIRYIPNGIDLRLWPAHRSPPPNGIAEILCVSRFVPRKRHVDLVLALERLRRTGLRFEAHLVGDGPTRGVITRLVHECGLQSHVRFHGTLEQADIRELMRSMTIFCLPSTWEGMPGAVMEAMAAGLPVVGTRVNGTDMLVVEGITGRLVPARAPEQLARALEECLRDPESVSEMGRAGRRQIEREFSLEKMIDRKERLYADAVTWRR